MSGRVYLVGAGCGSADLLTLRGRERLSRCDCVVYDDLIDPAILDFAPKQAQRIYMGKRSGHHSAPQSGINDKLVALAQAGKVVVRLKGGDPFVFGRGGEEILALQRAGISFEVVPGISSAIAIPAGAGIPVTHRGISRSFHVITGHTADTPDGLPADLPHLAKSGGPLVFLMGLRHLALIARRLMEYGRSPDTPAAVISGGNSPTPAVVRGTLADIAAKSAGILPPAVIVVGETASFDFSSTIPAPLDGVRIGITGTPSMIEKLRGELRELGANVQTVAPMVIRESVPSPALSGLCTDEPKWVVLTSPNGVAVFFRHLKTLGIDLRRLHACQFAVIGPATQAALAECGVFADLCPAEHTSAGLTHALLQTANPGEAIWLLRSAKGAPVLRDLPEQAGFIVHDVALYDTVPDTDRTGGDPTGLNYLTFSSAGGVTEFFRQHGALPEGVLPVCIGPVTAARLQTYTDRPFLLSRDAGSGHLVEAILAHHRKTQKRVSL